jgi:exopolyphosphatase/guanosine-5'-triphosphate,3'-diphosphate pyrophosphatase
VRVAAVDLGTNSTRFLVADVEDGRIEEVARGLRITGLGEGVDARRLLLPLPIARVRNTLTDFRREIEHLVAERTLAVGTSAVRDADNGEAFLGEVEWSYGFATRLLSGDEEAALTFRGALLGRDDSTGTMVVDLGGGSTELVMEDRAVSVDVGSVRMTEQHGEDIDAISAHVREVLPGELRPERAIGVAGTITSLAALDLGLDAYDPDRVHGHVLSAAPVEEQLQRLAALPVEERRRLPALEPDRAPVIVAGAAILHEVLRFYRLEAIEASEHDLLHGVALEAAALPEPVERDAPPGAYTCC